MVVSLIALFVALSGTALATSEFLIGSAQIQDRSINPIDLSTRTISVMKGKRGVPGPDGVQGAPGAKGGFDPAKVIYVDGPAIGVQNTHNSATTVGQSDAVCPLGTKVIGGGYKADSAPRAGIAVLGSYLVDERTWRVVLKNDSTGAIGFSAMAVCAAP